MGHQPERRRIVYPGRHYDVQAVIEEQRVKFIVTTSGEAPPILKLDMSNIGRDWSCYGYSETRRRWPWRDRPSINEAAMRAVRRAEKASVDYDFALLGIIEVSQELAIVEEITASL